MKNSQSHMQYHVGKDYFFHYLFSIAERINIAAKLVIASCRADAGSRPEKKPPTAAKIPDNPVHVVFLLYHFFFITLFPPLPSKSC